MVRIPVGYAGVIYSMNGGVKDNTLSPGYHIIKPTEHVKCFTTSNEQLLLTKDEREGSEGDDSFKVSTSDDASIAISFQMSYKFNEAQLVDTYKKFRGMDGEAIVANRVKSVLKSKVSEVTTDYSMMDIYSGNRSEINSKLTDYLDGKFIREYGINVIDASIIDVHPDDQLKEAINNRVTALQKKQQAQAEQETAKVEAETALIKAENAAAIKIKEAEAEAESNKLKAASITEELINMKEAEARLKHGWVTVQSGGTVAVTE
ncbi:MAG: prohibitin family protein [Lachnospiraceae bacterium]|nr:prohibitin family protein [Lachnospiraceae bacterium]